MVSGVGTGGTLTGIGSALKARKPGLKMIAVEPEDSAVLSGGPPGPHKIQGIGAGFIPAILDTKLIDETIRIGNETAFRTSREVARLEGVAVGISAGAALGGGGRDRAAPGHGGQGDRRHSARHRRALSLDAPCSRGSRWPTPPLSR